MSINDLQRRFGIPGIVQIDAGRGGLPRVVVTSALASAEVYLHGAHVTSFQPRGEAPVLFLSERSDYDAARPIRGGIPVVFPWFGPRAGDPGSPAHGFARLRDWTLAGCVLEPDGAVELALTLASDADCQRIWPAAWRLRMVIRVSQALDLALEVQADAAPFTYEAALHTYLAVGDVREVRLDGLGDTAYLDKTDGFRRKMQAPGALHFDGETDRVYLDTESDCRVHDPVLGRTLLVAKRHSRATVVWNPWLARAQAMADFGDAEWPQMLCVETANLGESAVQLAAGATHSMEVRIAVER